MPAVKLERPPQQDSGVFQVASFYVKIGQFLERQRKRELVSDLPMEPYCLAEKALSPVVFFLLPQNCAPLSEGGRFAQLIVELPVEFLRDLEVSLACRSWPTRRCALARLRRAWAWPSG